MAKAFSELTKDWPAERRERVKARARHLIAEEMTLRDLRKALDLTQVQLGPARKQSNRMVRSGRGDWPNAGADLK